MTIRRNVIPLWRIVRRAGDPAAPDDAMGLEFVLEFGLGHRIGN
jgi:hypothetical protein